MSSARVRVGTVSLAHVAEAELAVLTPPGSRLSPELNRAVVERLRSRRSRERERNRGAGPRSGVRRPWGRPAPRCCAGQARGAGRRGKKSSGSRGCAVRPCGACRRGVSAGRAGDRARGQAERPGDATRWADKLWGGSESGQALAVLTPPGSKPVSDVCGQRNGVGEVQRNENDMQRPQSSESGPNGAGPVPRDWRQQARGSGRRGKIQPISVVCCGGPVGVIC